MVIVAVLVIIIGAIAAFYVIRTMKGKLEIELAKTGFNSGEPVKGSVTLTTRKSLELRRLYVALIGYQIIEHCDSDGKRQTRKNEIYRDEFNLEDGLSIPSGDQKTYEFSLVAPGNKSPAGGDTANDHPGSALVNAVGSAVQALGALGAFGTGSRRLEWKVEARADLPGVDIATSKNVRVNMM
jgi:hypothetical protein